MRGQQEYALSVTSQFYFCSLPLRLDTYPRCGFACTYCFGLARGGNRKLQNTGFDASKLDRRLDRVATGQVKSAVDEFLAQGQPIHLGGMTDPFPPAERKSRITLRVLKVLAAHQFPAVVSTKSALFAEDPYLEVLARGRFVVQVSLSSLDETLLSKIDIGTPSPRDRLMALERAAQAGVPTSVRIQPILPGHESDAFDVVHASASAGARHAGVEHLKLPVERSWRGDIELKHVLGEQVIERFARTGHRIGREWILPVQDRLPVAVDLAKAAHTRGMTFGFADNDLLWLSDGTCCCSGSDLMAGFSSHFRCTYTTAVRTGLTNECITLLSLEREWTPSHSIARFVNSRSRLASYHGRGAPMRSYLESRWNGSPNGNSPAAFFGVEDTGTRDRRGFSKYALSDDARSLAQSVETP